MPQVMDNLNAHLSLACHRLASPATSPWDTLCGEILHNMFKGESQLGRHMQGVEGNPPYRGSNKCRSKQSVTLWCMEDRQVESERVM